MVKLYIVKCDGQKVTGARYGMTGAKKGYPGKLVKKDGKKMTLTARPEAVEKWGCGSYLLRRMEDGTYIQANKEINQYSVVTKNGEPVKNIPELESNIPGGNFLKEHWKEIGVVSSLGVAGMVLAQRRRKLPWQR